MSRGADARAAIGGRVARFIFVRAIALRRHAPVFPALAVQSAKSAAATVVDAGIAFVVQRLARVERPERTQVAGVELLLVQVERGRAEIVRLLRAPELTALDR